MAESASVWRCGRGGGRAQGHERGGVVNQWIARVIGHVAARGAISGRREAGGRGAQLSRHHHVFTCPDSIIGTHTTETHRQAWAFRIILAIRELEGMHWRWGKGRASQGMVPQSARFRARRDG